MSFSRDQRRLTVWMLVFSILLYPVLTYLGTPLVQSHADGQWTIVCTLQGEKAVFVDLGEEQSSSPEDCPALKLLQLVASASLVAPPSLPVHPLHGLIVLTPLDAYPFLTKHFSAFASRAPPLA